MTSSTHQRGLAISFAGVLILSPDSLFIRLLEFDDLTLIFFRGLLPVVTITFVLGLYYRKRFYNALLAIGWAGLINGCLYTITNITFVHSIQQTSVANTLVILSSSPVFAAIFSWLLLKERQKPVTWLVTILSMIGIFIIGLGSYQTDGVVGDLLALVCAISTACSAVLVRYRKHIDLVPSVLVGSLLLAIYGGIQMPVQEISQIQFFYIGVIGLIIVPLAFICLTMAPRFISSAEVQLVFLLEAILGPLWVWVVIDEMPSINTILGGTVLLLSVAWFAIHSLNQPRRAKLGKI